MRKIPFAGIELTSQRVRGLRGTSELPGRLRVHFAYDGGQSDLWSADTGNNYTVLVLYKRLLYCLILLEPTTVRALFVVFTMLFVVVCTNEYNSQYEYRTILLFFACTT